MDCIRIYFKRRYGFEAESWPRFHIDTKKEFSLDVEVAASGFSLQDEAEFREVL